MSQTLKEIRAEYQHKRSATKMKNDNKRTKIINGRAYTIESMPLPQIKGRGRPRKYPLADLRQVGECFMLPPNVNKAEVNSVRACASKFQRDNPGVEFSVRKHPNGCYGCWRTK